MTTDTRAMENGKIYSILQPGKMPDDDDVNITNVTYSKVSLSDSRISITSQIESWISLKQKMKTTVKYIYDGAFTYSGNTLSTLKTAKIKDITFAAHGTGYDPVSKIKSYSTEGAASFSYLIPYEDFNTALPYANISPGTLSYNYHTLGHNTANLLFGGKRVDPSPVAISRDRSVIPIELRSSDLKLDWWDNAFSSSSQNSGNKPDITLNKNYDVSEVLASLAVSTQSGTFQTEISDRSLTINASSWTGSIKINFAAKAAAQGERLDAKQIDFSSATPAGSILQGGDGNDQLWGKAGWDVFDGGKGNDLIRAGNGRDVLTGGSGADELHGDFGWNTYKSEKDGFSDLIAIKSDQHLSNWIFGKAGNNANGERADIIEGLDANDKIRIIGVFSPDITVRTGATAHGVSGIGIYAKGALEALYTGGDLSVAQLTAMTSGDGSAAALNNQVSSYGWTGV